MKKKMKEEKGLSKGQAHRLLENVETLALAHKLQLQLLEALGRDIQGMLSGNDIKEEIHG